MARLRVSWEAGEEWFELDEEDIEMWKESDEDTFMTFDAYISSVFPELEADVIE